MSPIRIASPLLGMMLCWPGSCAAYQINSVSVNPATPSSSAPVALEIDMMTPNMMAFLSAPTIVQVSGNDIHVNVFVDCGMLTALGSLTETVDLGVLKHGVYNYSVLMTPAIDAGWGRDQRFVTGSFAVMPEPHTASLALLAAAGVLWRRQRRVR